MDVTALIHAFNNTPNPHFLVLPNSRYETMTTGGSDTVALSVVPKEGFSGTVALTCTHLSTSLAGATCNFDNASVSTPGSANITIQTSSVQDPQTGTVTLTGTSGSITNSVAINVSVTAPDFSITSGNSTETVSTGGSTTDTITVTPVQGFTGGVSFTCSGTSGTHVFAGYKSGHYQFDLGGHQHTHGERLVFRDHWLGDDHRNQRQPYPHASNSGDGQRRCAKLHPYRRQPGCLHP